MTDILYDVDDQGVVTLTLNRPGKHNALTVDMLNRLQDLMIRIDNDGGIRVVILAAIGPIFCAGGDLRWMQSMANATSDERRQHARLLAGLLATANGLSKPLIARVQGSAFGAGVGLLSVCDAVVASDSASFGLTETKLGLVPATLAPFLAARMAENALRRMLLSSQRISAAEARAAGLLSQVVPSSELDQAIEDEVAPYLSCAPQAIAATKALLGRLTKSIEEDAIEASIDCFLQQMETDEAAEGLAAFFEGRIPRWAV